MTTSKKAAVNKAAKKSTSPKKAATAKPPVQKKRVGIKRIRTKNDVIKLRSERVVAVAAVADGAPPAIVLRAGPISVRSLAKNLGILPGTLLNTLFRNGIIALVDEPLSFEAAQLAAKLSGFTICQTSQKPATAPTQLVGQSLRVALQEALQRPFLKLDLPDFTPDENQKVVTSGYFFDARGVRHDIRHIPSGLDLLQILSSDDPDAAMQEHYAKCEAESAVEKTPVVNKVETATQRIKDLEQLNKRVLEAIRPMSSQLLPILSCRQAEGERVLREVLGLSPIPGPYGEPVVSGWAPDPRLGQDDVSFLHELAAELISLGQAIAREAIIKDV